MQFGGAFHRIMQNTVYANPRHDPPQMLKFDLANGYYRIRLTPSAAQELAIVFLVSSLPLLWWAFLCASPWGGTKAHHTFVILRKLLQT